MSFPRYPAYKDSGVEWLGDVPEHWKVIEARREIAFLTSGSRGWAEYYSDEGPIFLRIGNLTRDSIHIDLEDIQRVSPPPGVEGDRTKVSSGDVLFSITAYLGSVAVVPQDLERAYVSQHVCLARLTGRRLLPEWLAYSVLSSTGKAYLESESYGGTKVQLALDDIKSFPLPLPSLDEQLALTSLLDHETAKIDALIAEQQRLIELLQEKRQAVISHAVTKGLNPDAPMKDSGVEWLGEVPEHWEVIPLKYLCSVLRDGTHLPPSRVTAGIPLLSVRNIQEDTFGLRDDDSCISEQDYLELCRSFIPSTGDTLLAIVGATMGKAAVVPDTLDRFHIQRSLAIFRTIPKILKSNWLLRVFASTGFKALLWRHVGYSAQPGIYLGVLKDVGIPVPPKGEQQSILAMLDESLRIHNEIMVVAVESIALLQERRSALISAAVTGQIDVRGLAPEAVAA
jgi:type I restriction enzyme S subunit